MKVAVTALLAVLLYVLSANGQAKSENFQLAPSKYKQHYAVGAANGDPSARTFADIAKVNSKLAKHGNTQAAFLLGLAYLQGYGVPQDSAEAERWLSTGAVEPDDEELLASIYRDGDYLPQNATKAELWYRKAGRPGDLFALAQMYETARPAQVQ